MARLKARLVARGYARTYGVDYSDTFSPVAKLNSIRLFIFIATSQQWMIHQLDIKNVFLHGDLEEEVYLEQPGFVAQGGVWEGLLSEKSSLWIEAKSPCLVWKIQ